MPVAKTQIGDPVSMTLDDDGNVYLFLVTAVNETTQPTVIALNRDAEIIWKRALNIPLTLPSMPTIYWDGQSLNLFWISDYQLHTTQMNTAGDVVEPISVISGEKIVDSYDVALNADNSLMVWYAGQRRDPGLYVLDGDLAAPAVLVDAEGIRPMLQYDGTGTLYASWAHHPPGFGNTVFFYASYPDGEYVADQETAVYRPILSPSDILSGPWLGLDQTQLYLVWNISVRTGPNAGQITTEYVHFAKEHLTAVIGPKTIAVPSIADLDYTHEPEDGLAAGLRVFPITGEYPGTLKVGDVALNGAAVPGKELALAFEAQVQHDFRKTRGQVATLFLQDGEPTGYQLLSFTTNASVDPALTSDDEGRLYLTWLERADTGGFQVYFASTAPDIRRSLAGLTWGDIGRIGRETVFGLLSGAVLSPVVVLVWIILPLFVLFATSFLRRKDDDKLTRTGTIISLLLAGAVYWGAKLLTIPGIRSYVPFSAWVPAIPDWLQAPLQIGVPLMITIVAINVAWRLTYRRDSTSLLYFASLFAVVDGVLTMAIYGFLFFNLI